MAIGGSFGLGITLTASDLASGVIKSVSKNFAGLDDQVDKSMAKFAKSIGFGIEPVTEILKEFSAGMAVATAGLGILAGAFGLANEAGKFEFQLAEIGATSLLTAEQMALVKSRALEIGAGGKAGPEEVAAAMRELANSTLSGNDALRALGPTIDLVQASFGRLSPQQAGGLVARTLASFPELAGNATTAVDLLARSFKLGLKPEEIESVLRRAAQGASYLGHSLEEVLTTAVATKAAGFGINHLSQELVHAASRSSNFARAMNEARTGLRDTSITAESTGSIASKTWDEAERNISNSFETIKKEFGLKVMEVLEPGILKIRDLVGKAATAFHNLPDPVKKAFAVFTVVSAAAVAIGGVVAAVSALGPILMPTLSLIAGGVATAFGPALPLIAGIVAGAYLIKSAWDSNFAGVRDLVVGVFDKISLAVESLVQLLETGEISGALADDLLKAENGPVFDFVEGISQGIAELQQLWDLYGDDVIEVFQNIKAIAEPIISSIGIALKAIFEVAGGALNTLVGVFTGNLSKIYRGLASIVNAGIDAVNGMISLFDKLPASFKKKIFGVENFEGLKIDAFAAEDVARAFGDEQGAQDVIADRERKAAMRAGTGVPSTAAATIPGSSPISSIPSSRPVSAPQTPSATSNPAMDQLLEAIKALGERPVVVNGQVTIDGMKLADWQARQHRDRNAARGVIKGPR